jgi:hypothetical protein
MMLLSCLLTILAQAHCCPGKVWVGREVTPQAFDRHPGAGVQAGVQWTQCPVESLTPAKPPVAGQLSLDEDDGHWAPACAGATVRGFECLASIASASSGLFADNSERRPGVEPKKIFAGLPGASRIRSRMLTIRSPQSSAR